MKKLIIPFVFIISVIISFTICKRSGYENNSLFMANIEALSSPENPPEPSKPLDDGIVTCDGEAIYLFRKIIPYEVVVYQHLIEGIDLEYIVSLSECFASGPNLGGNLVGNNNSIGMKYKYRGPVECIPDRCGESFYLQ